MKLTNLHWFFLIKSPNIMGFKQTYGRQESKTK